MAVRDAALGCQLQRMARHYRHHDVDEKNERAPGRCHGGVNRDQVEQRKPPHKTAPVRSA